MKRIGMVMIFVLGLAGMVSAGDWPVYESRETVRIAVASTANTYTAMTAVPLTLAWNYIQFKVESVLDAAGATIPGNAGLNVILSKTSTMPIQSSSMSAGYKILLVSEPSLEDRQQTSSTLVGYYANTTLTADTATRINLIADTWKIRRQ